MVIEFLCSDDGCDFECFGVFGNVVVFDVDFV